MTNYWKEQIEQFKENPIFIFIGLGMIFIFAYAFYIRLIIYPKMEKEGHYTIGTTIEIYKPPKRGTAITYSFITNGNKTISEARFAEGVTVPGGRYLVKFLPSRPSLSNIYFNCPIPNGIEKAPSEGWKKPPFPCEKD